MDLFYRFISPVLELRRYRCYLLEAIIYSEYTLYLSSIFIILGCFPDFLSIKNLHENVLQNYFYNRFPLLGFYQESKRANIKQVRIKHQTKFFKKQILLLKKLAKNLAN